MARCRDEAMATPKRVDSWGVTDEFWRHVEPLIPVRKRVRDRAYVRKPGAGRPAKAARQVFEAIVYVLRTGCPWKALPSERFGSASAVHGATLISAQIVTLALIGQPFDLKRNALSIQEVNFVKSIVCC